MFGLGFVVIAGVVHLGMRDTLYLHADIRSEKLLILKEWSGKAYSASFGSSHMQDGFDPRIFDSTMADTPAQTRSINLAIAGGSQSEQRLTALEFLRTMKTAAPAETTTGPHACMVILELTAGANLGSDHLVHPRTINIYDWKTARFVTRLTSPTMGNTQRVGRIGVALAAMGMHYINLGMLSSKIFPAPLDQEILDIETRDDRRGLMVAPPNPPWAVEKISRLIAESPKQPVVTQGVILPGNRELVDELKTASPVHNLQVVYVVLPKTSDLTEQVNFIDTLDTQHGPVPIVNLARPDLYPQIYHTELWHDDSHLNGAGAQLATKLLAENLKSWYAVHGEPASCGR
jgi:hypothetical protein